MKKKIEIMGVEIHPYTAKEAMECVMEYRKSESLHLIELVTVHTLIQFMREEERRVPFQEFDLTIAGSKDLLEAAGIVNSKQVREAESRTFVKLLLQFLHKNHMRVFLLTETEEALDEMKAFLEERYSGIQVVGGSAVAEDVDSDDMLINQVNGAEVECLLSEIPSPLQEELILRTRAQLHAKMWIGLGTEFRDSRERVSMWRRLGTFFGGKFLKTLIKRERLKG